MESKDEVNFSPIKLQKHGDYYKIPVPPELINEGILNPDNLYEISISKAYTDHKDETIISPARLQKQGKYYKISVPPELIRKKILEPKTLYEVTFKRME